MQAWNAETIRRARKARCLTQTELADKLGCRQQTISEWELGCYSPKNAYRKLLSMFFAEHAPNPESRHELTPAETKDDTFPGAV